MFRTDLPQRISVWRFAALFAARRRAYGLGDRRRLHRDFRARRVQYDCVGRRFAALRFCALFGVRVVLGPSERVRILLFSKKMISENGNRKKSAAHSLSAEKCGMKEIEFAVLNMRI